MSFLKVNIKWLIQITLLSKNKKYVQKLYLNTHSLKELMKKYRAISDQVIDNLPDIEDWYEDEFLKEQNFKVGRIILLLFIKQKMHKIFVKFFQEVSFRWNLC